MGKIRLSSKSSDLNYPSLKPTLNLNFAAGKSLDPRITFTRNSTGTYVGSDGLIKTAVANEPRFDHDFVTGECLGLLVETNRTNLIRNSQNITAGTWAGGSSSTPNPLVFEKYVDTSTTILAPDGISRVPFVSLGDRGMCYETLGFGQNTTVTLSFYARRDPRYSGGSINAVISDNFFNFNSLLFNDRWTRITHTAQAGSGFQPIGIYQLGISDTYRGIYLWGFQCEAGTHATSYIRTSGSTVTRQADIANITGTNFSSWYNSSEGTLLSIDETPASYTTSSSLVIRTNTNTVSNLLYYPKTIQYPTLKTMNAYSSIVGDGLVLHLDAGIRNSYSGSGTTWTDLSGQGNNGTLTNGPTYSSTNGGSIVFDGTNDYVNLGNILNIGTGQFSIEYFGSASVMTTNYAKIASKGSYLGGGWMLGHSKNPDNSYSAYFQWGNASGVDAGVSGDIVFTDTIYHVIVTRDSNNMIKYYLNTKLKDSERSDFDFTTVYDYQLARSVTGEYFKGNIFVYRHYNRALTASEIQQNFNATRGRFGL